MRLDDNLEKGSKAFIVAIDSDLIVLGATVNLILQAKVEHEYIVGTLLKVSELKPSNHLAKQGYSFSNWTLQHWPTFAALLGNDYIRNITKKGKRFMTYKKMDPVLDLLNEPDGSLEPLGSYLNEFQGDVTIDSYLESFRKVVMLMKKYPIQSSATRIETLNGSGALPQETLEYLEIQPPVEAMLPWTDFDNEVSNGIKRLAPLQCF